MTIESVSITQYPGPTITSADPLSAVGPNLRNSDHNFYMMMFVTVKEIRIIPSDVDIYM